MARYEELHVTKPRIGDKAHRMDNNPWAVNFVVGAEAANAINVAAQLVDAHGRNLEIAAALTIYLATDAAGLSPATIAPTAGMVIGTDGALIESVANLSGTVISKTDGKFDITLTDVGVPTFYMVSVLPDGKLAISGAITFV